MHLLNRVLITGRNGIRRMLPTKFGTKMRIWVRRLPVNMTAHWLRQGDLQNVLLIVEPPD